jgi:hypothetical protein
MALDRPEKTEMHFEWNWPSMYSTDGIQWFSFEIESRFRGDHSPGHHVLLCICNLKLLDFGYYNIHHVSHDFDELINRVIYGNQTEGVTNGNV